MTITRNHRERMSAKTLPWLIWCAINLCTAAYFLWGLVAPASSIKTAWLPGKTTHGHHQIEMDCNACHSADANSDPDKANVMQLACIRCHGEQLEAAADTHPAKKFRDPSNADLLTILDAQNCLTCHVEHAPEQTSAMGLTLPSDYCWHCHQEVADSRPSHQGMAFDSCQTAGCHNYHDNRSLYEKYLEQHHGLPDHLNIQRLPTRSTAKTLSVGSEFAVGPRATAADHPANIDVSAKLIRQWKETSHAGSGVNCSDCHGGNEQRPWSEHVGMTECANCHQRQTDSFVMGKHGMRLASQLSHLTPAQARLPMDQDAVHFKLDCNACHQGHGFDTRYAAVDACLQCHVDDHSLSYSESAHARLWRDELVGTGTPNSGVTCATCHFPRLHSDEGIWVTHDQNANLRPNETMARQVCASCHGLEYSLSALADKEVVKRCFADPPTDRIQSVQMARKWFDDQRAKREARKRAQN